jgi:hypothetical protein
MRWKGARPPPVGGTMQADPQALETARVIGSKDEALTCAASYRDFARALQEQGRVEQAAIVTRFADDLEEAARVVFDPPPRYIVGRNARVGIASPPTPGRPALPSSRPATPNRRDRLAAKARARRAKGGPS